MSFLLPFLRDKDVPEIKIYRPSVGLRLARILVPLFALWFVAAQALDVRGWAGLVLAAVIVVAARILFRVLRK